MRLPVGCQAPESLFTPKQQFKVGNQGEEERGGGEDGDISRTFGTVEIHIKKIKM